MEKRYQASLTKKWYACPKCGKRLLLYAQGAKSEKVYLKCKSCKEEIEIKLP